MEYRVPQDWKIVGGSQDRNWIPSHLAPQETALRPTTNWDWEDDVEYYARLLTDAPAEQPIEPTENFLF